MNPCLLMTISYNHHHHPALNTGLSTLNEYWNEDEQYATLWRPCCCQFSGEVQAKCSTQMDFGRGMLWSCLSSSVCQKLQILIESLHVLHPYQANLTLVLLTPCITRSFSTRLFLHFVSTFGLLKSFPWHQNSVNMVAMRRHVFEGICKRFARLNRNFHVHPLFWQIFQGKIMATKEMEKLKVATVNSTIIKLQTNCLSTFDASRFIRENIFITRICQENVLGSQQTLKSVFYSTGEVNY